MRFLKGRIERRESYLVGEFARHREEVKHIGHHGISAANVQYSRQSELVLPDILDFIRECQSVVVVQESWKTRSAPGIRRSVWDQFGRARQMVRTDA